MAPRRVAVLALVVGWLAVACGDSGGTRPTLPSISLPSSVPESGPPDTGAPDTQPPDTEAPDTEPPDTEAPDTEPPDTEAPDTQPPDTEPRDTEAEDTEPPISDPEDASSDHGTSWWSWLLAGVALAAIITVIVLVTRKKKPTGPTWHEQTAGVLGESDQLTTHLVTLPPGGVAALAREDAARIAALMAAVQQLTMAAPDEPARQTLWSIQEPLRALHGTLDAVSMAGVPPTEADVSQLRERANAVHSATSLARASLFPPPPPPHP